MPLDPDALAGMVIDTLARALGPVQAELRAAVADVTVLKGQVATLDARWNDIGAMRERLAVLETKAATEPPAGPQGPPGVPGKDGKDGENGKPGLTYQGVYQDGKSYEAGDVATWAGSTWHCNEVTETKPGDSSKAWTLMVKRGRDGKDGHDAPGALPVVKVGGR